MCIISVQLSISWEGEVAPGHVPSFLDARARYSTPALVYVLPICVSMTTCVWMYFYMNGWMRLVEAYKRVSVDRLRPSSSDSIADRRPKKHPSSLSPDRSVEPTNAGPVWQSGALCLSVILFLTSSQTHEPLRSPKKNHTPQNSIQ